MRQKPLVSIVIPVYNGTNYMREAIDSALAQTYPCCEVIVVNDGSDDGGSTDAVARSYGERIRYFKKKNGGVATAVNYGIKQMRGEYFAWLSHDDIYLPEKIEKEVAALEAAPKDVEIVHGNFDFLSMETGKRSPVDWLTCYTREELEHGAFAPLFLAIHGSTVLIRRSCFSRVGLYREDLPATQDSEFLFRAMRGHRSIFLKDCLIIGRQHAAQGQRTMQGFPREYNDTFQKMIASLTDTEMTSLYGTVRNFYYRLYRTFCVSEVASSVLDYIRREFESRPAETNIKTLESLKNKILGGASYLYLFGAGAYGKQLVHDLEVHGVAVTGFIDNDPKKQSIVIEGHSCTSLDAVLDRQAETTIVISMLSSEAVRKQLQQYHFRRLLSYGACRDYLLREESVSL